MTNMKDPKVSKANDNANPNANIVPGRVKKLQDDWDKKRGKGSVAVARNPFNNESVVFTKMEFEGNAVKVWTSDRDEAEPQYVVVNPPIAYPSGGNTGDLIEDPLTAIAITITGVREQ